MTTAPVDGGGPDEPSLAAAVLAWLRSVLPDGWLAAADAGEWERLGALRPDLDEEAYWASGYETGFTIPSWPPAFGGLGLPGRSARVVNLLLGRYRTPRPRNPIGMSLVAPALMHWGTADQQQRFLAPLARQTEIWCQLFSEPGAGSDLAGLATRAVRGDGDRWVIDGQKTWSTLAHRAQFGLLLARTDPTVPKHAGITAFLVPLDAPGVEVRPLRQITGEADFNEVFLDGVEVGDDLRLGPEGEGWRVSHTVLMNERVNDSGAGAALPGTVTGHSVERIIAENAPVDDELLADRLVDVWIEAMLVRATNARVSAARAAGETPGREGSVTKLMQAEHSRRLHEVSLDLLGARGVAWAPDDGWADTTAWAYLRSKSKTIAGGTVEIMRNILGERILGLPREPSTDRDVPWQDVRRSS